MRILGNRYRIVEEVSLTTSGLSLVACHEIDTWKECSAVVTLASDPRAWSRVMISLENDPGMTARLLDHGWEVGSPSENRVYWAVFDWPTRIGAGRLVPILDSDEVLTFRRLFGTGEAADV